MAWVGSVGDNRTVPAITGLAYLGLSVRDARRSAGWYRELLGLETVREQLDEAGQGAVLLREPASGMLIGLVAHPGNDGEPFSEFRTGLDHAEFGVPSREALQAWVARLDELGVAHSGIKQAALGAMVTFRDPDNIQLELYWPYA
jgi:catechol 2,3-dioxygenase-like lactoylglutathione lyase family enzyme